MKAWRWCTARTAAATTGRPGRGLRLAATVCWLVSLCVPQAHGEEPGLDISGDGRYGIVSRIQGSSQRVIFRPLVGDFREGLEVGYFNRSGERICGGIVQTVYRDEIYSVAADCEKFEEISPDLVVAISGNPEDISKIYKNKRAVATVIREREWKGFPGIPRDIGEDQYEQVVLSSSLPVLVEFYTTWCPHCRRFAPILGEIAKEFEGKVRVATLDKDKNRDLAKKLNVQGVPEFFLVKDYRVVTKMHGAPETREPIISHIKSVLNFK